MKDLKGPSAAKISEATGALSIPDSKAVSEAELQRYGITDELREFVRGLTIDTFKSFPLEAEIERECG